MVIQEDSYISVAALIWTLLPILGEFSTTLVLVGGFYVQQRSGKAQILAFPGNLENRAWTFNQGLGNQTQPPGILNLELVRQSSSNSEEFIPVVEETATAGFSGSRGSWARESGEGLPCPMVVG